MPIASEPITVSCLDQAAVVTLNSADGSNILSLRVIGHLLEAVTNLRTEAEAEAISSLIITGNERFFSAGADLNEIAKLTGPEAYKFSRLGQRLMNSIDSFPVPVIAAIRGYCMGGGMDLALACDYRIAAPNAVFGHRGASLGLITGWGGTQRLPRLIGRSRALQMFLLAEKVGANEALKIGLANHISADPIAEAQRILVVAD
jgi:enoyl-CoA hydratase/carnithine racemase